MLLLLALVALDAAAAEVVVVVAVVVMVDGVGGLASTPLIKAGAREARGSTSTSGASTLVKYRALSVRMRVPDTLTLALPEDKRLVTTVGSSRLGSSRGGWGA